MSEMVLIATELSHSFATSGGPSVLQRAALEVAAGEAVAVTGVSGCGKSTLLHILGGLARPDAGQIEVAGTALGGLSQTQLGALRNRKLGFVYQQHHLIGEFSAQENVALPLLVGGTEWEPALASARELLAAVELTEQARRVPAQLSGGERQRVAIARALVNEPACVIADEPTGNLDPKSAAVVTELLLANCRQRNCGLLVATHDLNFADRLQRRLELREGKLCAVSR